MTYLLIALVVLGFFGIRSAVQDMADGDMQS